MQYLTLLLGLVGLAVTTYGSDRTLSQKSSERHTMREQSAPIVTVSLPDFIKTNPKYRLDCSPDVDEYRSFCELNLSINRTMTTSNQSCAARGCIWDTSVPINVPTCYIPIAKGGYSLAAGPNQLSEAITQYRLTRLSAKSSRLGSSLFGKLRDATDEFSLFNHDIQNLDVQVSVSGTDKVRLTIRDADTKRYEVPVPVRWEPSAPSSALTKLKFQLTKTSDNQVGFRIQRVSTGSILFDTSFFANGFIYDNQFLQIITTIPSRNVYGFGENTHSSFRHQLRGSNRYGMFAQDQWPTGTNENLYGAHPFYMLIEPTGEAFGVFILNSNAQDYKFDEYDTDQAMLTYRTIGGILDVLFFAGPDPEYVIRQYQSVIGNPYMPPYWALGFQLSRYGFDSLKNMRAAMERTVSANISLDVLYGDIDYFHDRLDFTWDPVTFNGLPAFVDSLHDSGMRFITILDPAIDSEARNYSVYTDGQKKDIWIKWPERQNLQFNETGNRNMLGKVWPNGRAVFPDFFYPPANEWWISQIVDYHKKMKFDGVWIDMNEPANFGTNKLAPANRNLHCPVASDLLENPLYKTASCGDYLSDKTLCMVGEQTDGQGNIYKQYDVHSLYGLSEAIVSLTAARATENKRSIVISRSTFPTSGSFTGHWTGDNTAAWSHLKYNIIGILEFNLFSIPYSGADICGYFNNATEQMCQRWMQLGAFNPFFRNHNGRDNIDQDPGVFSPSAVESNRRVVQLRYTLIPYLYTLFHRVHISGGTVVRSMALVFPANPDCWSLDEQFLWGSSLLIAPVIYEDHLNKTLYLPATERWFDYYTGAEQILRGQITVAAPLDFIPVYLRGGAILPHQESAINTVASRKKPLYLIVALDQEQSAYGDLFWDDGESIDTYERSVYNYFIFNYKSKRLTIEPWTYKYPQMGDDIQLNDIKIFGLDQQPSRIVWNGQDLTPDTKWAFDTMNKVLHLKMLRLNVAKAHRFVFF